MEYEIIEYWVDGVTDWWAVAKELSLKYGCPMAVVNNIIHSVLIGD